MLQFNRAATTYCQNNHLQTQSAEILFDMLPLSANSVLDLGCGPGNCQEFLIKKYPDAKVIGCDNSPAMLAQNKNLTVLADACQLPFAPNSFDLIFSNMLIHWLPDLHKFFDDCWQICQTNGEIIIATLGQNSLSEARHALASIERENSINDFFEMQALGDFVYNSKWAEVFLATELITLEFDSPKAVFANLKLTGVTKKLRADAKQNWLSPRRWQQCLKNYPQTNGKYLATFEVITLRAKKLPPSNTVDPNTITRISDART